MSNGSLDNENNLHLFCTTQLANFKKDFKKNVLNKFSYSGIDHWLEYTDRKSEYLYRNKSITKTPYQVSKYDFVYMIDTFEDTLNNFKSRVLADNSILNKIEFILSSIVILSRCLEKNNYHLFLTHFFSIKYYEGMIESEILKNKIKTKEKQRIDKIKKPIIMARIELISILKLELERKKTFKNKKTLVLSILPIMTNFIMNVNGGRPKVSNLEKYISGLSRNDNEIKELFYNLLNK